MWCSLFKRLALALLIGLAPMIVAIQSANAISLPRKTPSGKVCRSLLGSAHMHTGKSKSMATVEEAHASAIRRWSGFTTWEYGRSWGDFRLAENRKGRCWIGKRGGWRCKVEAQPCRY